jgi:hypothetical protein
MVTILETLGRLLRTGSQWEYQGQCVEGGIGKFPAVQGRTARGEPNAGRYTTEAGTWRAGYSDASHEKWEHSPQPSPNQGDAIRGPVSTAGPARSFPEESEVSPGCPPQRQSISKLILARLSAAANRDDLIRDVCFREGIPWPEAEAIVAEVEAENEKTILRRQSPIVLTTAIMFALAGIILSGVAAFFIFSPILLDTFSFSYFFGSVLFGDPFVILLIIGLTLAIGGMIAFFEEIFRLKAK